MAAGRRSKRRPGHRQHRYQQNRQQQPQDEQQSHDMPSRPGCRCRIEVSCRQNPSEDPQKVRTAISNVFEYGTISTRPGGRSRMVVAVSENLGSLQRIREAIYAGRHQRVYRRALQKNQEGSATRLYLNKQAAFANKVAICDGPQESPLGPLVVAIISPDVEGVADWLACTPSASSTWPPP